MTSSKGASINDIHIAQANPSNDLKVLYILLTIHSRLGAGAGGIHKTDSSIRGRSYAYFTFEKILLASKQNFFKCKISIGSTSNALVKALNK